MQKKIENKNQKADSSTKTILIYAAAFWLLGYSIALIIFLWGVNFYPADASYQPSDSFLSLAFRNFKDALIYIYSPLYIIPLLFSSYLTIQWNDNKKYLLSLSVFIIPICLSLFLFYFLFALLQSISIYSISWLWEYGYTGEAVSLLIASLIQIILCLLLPFSLKNREKQKKILNPLVVGLSFFVIITFYIIFSAKTASASPPFLESLIQKAAETRNISFCEEIKKESRKRKFGAWRDYYNNCTTELAQIAVSADDVKLCEEVIKTIENKISKWEDGPDEKLKCLGLIAATTNNPVLCVGVGSCLDNISDIPLAMGRLKCFEELFLKTGNSAICGQIEERVFYATNEKSGDFKKYYKYKEICFYASAIILKNPGLCEKLTNEDNKKICYANVKQ